MSVAVWHISSVFQGFLGTVFALSSQRRMKLPAKGLFGVFSIFEMRSFAHTWHIFPVTKNVLPLKYTYCFGLNDWRSRALCTHHVGVKLWKTLLWHSDLTKIQEGWKLCLYICRSVCRVTFFFCFMHRYIGWHQYRNNRTCSIFTRFSVWKRQKSKRTASFKVKWSVWRLILLRRSSVLYFTAVKTRYLLVGCLIFSMRWCDSAACKQPHILHSRSLEGQKHHCNTSWMLWRVYF